MKLKLQKLLVSSSDDLAEQFQEHPVLNQLFNSIIEKHFTGVDFFLQTPDAILIYLDVPKTDELLAELYLFKSQILNQLHLGFLYPQVYNAVILDLTPETIQICAPFHYPNIQTIEISQFQNFHDNENLQKGLNVQIIYTSETQLYICQGCSPNLQFLSESADFIGNFMDLNTDEQRIRNQFDGIGDTHHTPFSIEALPFESLGDPPPPGIPQWESQPLFFDQPSWSKQSLSQHPSQSTMRLQPSFSGISLTNQPIEIIPDPAFTKQRIRGRIDFLIEQVGAIIVPNFNSIQSYEPHSIDEIRNYRLEQGTGLVVCFNLGWFSQIGADIPSRGDIVEFELVPGYGFSEQHSTLGNAKSSTYPFINNFEENKNNKIGQTQKRQQLFASEIDEFYKNNDFDIDEQITCSADKIQVIERVSRPEIAKTLMIHGNTYEGIVYTYSDQENYGFIKSFGLLQEGYSYSQGFEVYFKIQPQKSSFIPTRGDFVTFKSHWVEDKAQAREIKYLSTRISDTFSGICLAFYPPFVLFSCETDCQNLSNNIFFSKWKSIPQQIRQYLRIGSKVQFQMDTDISTQFRAIILVPEAKKQGVFSLSYSPSSLEKVKPINPFTSGLFLTQLQPIPFINAKIAILRHVKSNLVPRTITSVSPIIYAGMELPDMDQIILNTQLLVGQTVFLNIDFAIQAPIGNNQYRIQFACISENYVFFSTLESSIYLGISRQSIPVWVVGFPQYLNVLWAWKLDEQVESGQFDCDDAQFDAILINGIFSFSKAM
ncbi:hypothetical protein SS50377_23625 [Spironucleus salmonicida]|uniref:Uncharacterized protein n=1 Tax=Spironucleus salmonicida TaxID=348837 RepID=V6LVD2_9EUKA|nr:hypothetical protein SS50377_23625 [Spironucleus salmonicida]|eukprot:EST48607.1 hypothetical protein SS50377_11219 [Spironucleus salmonicida]